MKLCGKVNAGTAIALAVAVVTALWSAGVWAGEEGAPRISVASSGEGPAVLFLPGLMSSPDVYDPAIAELEGVATYKVSFAGMAGTPPVADPDPYIGPAAAAVADYLEAEGLSQVRLVGHSMGGLISLLVAKEKPDLVGSVLVIDSVPFLPALMMPGATPETAAGQAEALKAQMANAGKEQFLGFVSYGLPRQASSEESRAKILAAAAASDQMSAAVATGEMMGTDYGPALAGLDVPVTVLVPHNDAIGVSEDVLLGLYQAQYAGLADVTFHIVPDSRHFIMYDQPEAFAEALAGFVEGGSDDR